MPHLFYETFWATDKFNDRWEESDGWPFVWSTGYVLFIRHIHHHPPLPSPLAIPQATDFMATSGTAGTKSSFNTLSTNAIRHLTSLTALLMRVRC